jgi:hypothetical protein
MLLDELFASCFCKVTNTLDIDKVRAAIAYAFRYGWISYAEAAGGVARQLTSMHCPVESPNPVTTSAEKAKLEADVKASLGLR